MRLLLSSIRNIFFLLKYTSGIAFNLEGNEKWSFSVAVIKKRESDNQLCLFVNFELIGLLKVSIRSSRI
jgi:hypothetical protein